MRPFRLSLLLVVVSLLGLMASPAAAKTVKQHDLTFGAAPSAKTERPIAPGDYKAMLARCDTLLGTCQKDAIGVPYLAAAYMALWVILIIFLVMVRRGQGRLRGELDELRARLR